MGLPVCHRWKAGEDIAQVLLWIDAVPLAASVARVNSDVARANEIFKQWNINFNIDRIHYLLCDKFRWSTRYKKVSTFNALAVLGNSLYDTDPANSSIEVYYFNDFLEMPGTERFAAFADRTGIAMSAARCGTDVLAHEILHTLRKDLLPPYHEPGYRRCVMFPGDGFQRWDIRKTEALNFINDHSDW